MWVSQMLKKLIVNPDGPPLPVEPVSTTLKHNMSNRVLQTISTSLRSCGLNFVSHALLRCSMARVAHSGMTADEVTENIEAAVQTIAAKIRMVSSLTKRASVSGIV